MSYCRWSSDNYRCDVYALESDLGYEINVAVGRYPEPIPEVDYSLLNGTESDLIKFNDQRHAQSEYLKGKCGTPIVL